MKTRASYWQLLPFLRPHWWLFAKGGACIIGYVLMTLLLPYLAGQAALYIGQGNVAKIAHWLGLATVVFLVRSVFQYWENIWMISASLEVALSLRQQVYAHLHKLGLKYFERSQTGDLAYRLTEDIDRVGEIVHKMSQQFVSSGLQLIAIPIYMLYLNWPLTLAGLLLAPLMGWLISKFGRQMLILSRRSQTQVSNLSALLTEVFGSIRVVQAFAAQDYEVERFNREAEHNRSTRYRAERLKALQYPIVGFLEAISIMLLFFWGAGKFPRAVWPPKSLLAFWRRWRCCSILLI